MICPHIDALLINQVSFYDDPVGFTAEVNDGITNPSGAAGNKSQFVVKL
jgi:hypothetical protein